MTELQARKSLYTLLLIVLLSCAGIALPYPILAPLFLNEVNDFTTFANLNPKLLLGFLLAIYPLGVLIGSSFIGAASDIYGRKKVLMITLTISAIGYLCSVWALLSENYLLFALTRFITGISEGNIAIARAIAIDLSPPLDRTRSYSLVSATTYAGWLVGPLVGGLLQPYGNHHAFVVGAIAMALTIVLVHFLLTETKSPAQVVTSKLSLRRLIYQQNSFTLLKHQPIRRLFYVFLFSTLATNAFYEFYPLWLVESFNFEGPGIGFITAILTTAMILSSVNLLPYLKRRVGSVNACLIAMTLFAIFMLFHNLISEQGVWYIYPLIGVVIAIYNALLSVYASEKFDHEDQGKLMGLITTTFSLSNMLMAIVGSLIAIYGSVYAIMTGGILMIVAVLSLYYGFAGHPRLSENTSPNDKEISADDRQLND
ncbi:MFS transporter [Thalassotalea crassostreae]|uniref:MFS transporter n=1 Tax=Thalassotalea crassostreae TaxID=1763536 RepID=UPI0008397861|nr:MFS transporter [Thalassotalea crassostreae]